MNTLDKNYLNIAENILKNGVEKENRTGVNTISISGAMLQHDMSEGFPLLTTKKVFYKAMSVELEGFLKGITDKEWYKANKCNIWNEWCNPSKIPEGLSDEERKEFQFNESDLGPIYGSQWRDFNGGGYDQLQQVIRSLENKPGDRRMLVSAWNPLQLHLQALPPCHVLWQVAVRGEYLDLLWYQRSVDVFLGLPFNIASYGLLLSLLAHQFKYKPGILTGFLGDTHIYKNHIEQIKIMSNRLSDAKELPKLIIHEDFKDITKFDSFEDFKIVNYEHLGVLKGEVAI